MGASSTWVSPDKVPQGASSTTVPKWGPTARGQLREGSCAVWPDCLLAVVASVRDGCLHVTFLLIIPERGGGQGCVGVCATVGWRVGPAPRVVPQHMPQYKHCIVSSTGSQ